MNKISALIITYNEEKNIKEVIDCLYFADEIIILDSFSTDKTKQICVNNSKVKFYEREFDNFSSQRNYAISLTRYDWILFLDADERITMPLKDEILLELKNPKNSAYLFYRKFYFKKKPINFSGTQNDKRILLFNKNFAYYSKKLVHETLEIKGSIGYFKTKLIHYSYNSFNEYKTKSKHYSRLKAREYLKKNKKYSIVLQWIKSFFTFFYSYIIRLGILDGKNGVVISYLSAYSVYETYRQLKLLEK